MMWGRMKSRIMASWMSCLNPVDLAVHKAQGCCNVIDMFGGQNRVASATDQIGAISVASCCQAVGDQIALERGLAVDG